TVAMAAHTVEALRQATSQPLPSMPAPAADAGRGPALVASVATALVLLLGGGGWYVLRYVPEQARLEAERKAAEAAAEKARAQAQAEAEARRRQAEEDARVRAQLEEKLRLEEQERQAALDAGAAGAADAGAVAELPSKGGTGKSPSSPKGYNALLDEADRVRARQPARALSLYEQAEALKPSAVDPPVGRGYALLELGRAAESEVAFRQALTLNPTYAPALMGSAEAFKAQGKREQAITMYERYLDVLPDGAEANVARTNLQRLKR
ncbi:MAG: tetratricopeptide repeat protein, partial [Myxococcaceae bacterium]|nr:tetratricopeptide repeat protein [Myxococcaceae bacterium]